MALRTLDAGSSCSPATREFRITKTTSENNKRKQTFGPKLQCLTIQYCVNAGNTVLRDCRQHNAMQSNPIQDSVNADNAAVGGPLNACQYNTA